jgi:hypothetical protein
LAICPDRGRGGLENPKIGNNKKENKLKTI